MSNKDIRLACLKMAVERQGAKDVRPVLDIADEFYSWVEKSNADKPQGPAVGRKPSGRSGL